MNAPEKNHGVFYEDFTDIFVAEGARRDEALVARPPINGFALAHAPERPILPSGYALDVLEKRNHGPLWESGLSHNALGRLNQPELWKGRFRAHALRDAGGNIAALASLSVEGVDVWEIGVDVLRGQRAAGLGKAVVLAASVDIVESGKAAFYTLRCGQHPVAADGLELRLPSGLFAGRGRAEKPLASAPTDTGVFGAHSPGRRPTSTCIGKAGSATGKRAALHVE